MVSDGKNKDYLITFYTLNGGDRFIVSAKSMVEAIDSAKKRMQGIEYLKSFGRFIELNESFKASRRKF